MTHILYPTTNLTATEQLVIERGEGAGRNGHEISGRKVGGDSRGANQRDRSGG